MKLAQIVMAGMLAGTAFAQTANVIELKPTDTIRVQKAWDNLQKAQHEWDQVRDEMNVRYVLKADSLIFQEHQQSVKVPLPGFENSFEFSKDFKFIVPKPLEVKPTFSPYIMGADGR